SPPFSRATKAGGTGKQRDNLNEVHLPSERAMRAKKLCLLLTISSIHLLFTCLQLVAHPGGRAGFALKPGSGTLLVIEALKLPVPRVRPGMVYLEKHSDLMEGEMSLTHGTPLEVRPLTVEDAPTCDQIILTLPRHFGYESGRQACAQAVRTS